MEFEIENNLPENVCDFNSKIFNSSEIPVISSEIKYNDFFMNYMEPNLPCLLKDSTSNWESTRHWVNIEDGILNYQYLLEKYGHLPSTIYNCSERYFNSQKTEDSTFKDYISYWKNFKNNPAEHTKLLYLKDWHLKMLCKDDPFYQVPLYFASDWLNEYYTNCLSDDYRFVYMGVKDTWTPFHADVFSSYSWSANVFGKKKWILFPPGEEEYLKDDLNNFPYDISNCYNSRRHIEVLQNTGDILFVPSGWYHQVWNLEDTISVNHNWINSCNIKIVWSALRENLRLVVNEIEDCRDMDNFDQHCQLMLKSSFGMNITGFYDFVKYIAGNRIDMIKNNKSRVQFHGHIIGNNHVLHDLKALRIILEDFIHCDFVNSNFLKIIESKKLLDNIVQILDKNKVIQGFYL